VEAWIKEYNEEIPKRSLGGLTSAAYAKTLIQKPVKLIPDSKAQCYCNWGDVAPLRLYFQQKPLSGLECEDVLKYNRQKGGWGYGGGPSSQKE